MTPENRYVEALKVLRGSTQIEKNHPQFSQQLTIFISELLQTEFGNEFLLAVLDDLQKRILPEGRELDSEEFVAEDLTKFLAFVARAEIEILELILDALCKQAVLAVVSCLKEDNPALLEEYLRLRLIDMREKDVKKRLSASDQEPTDRVQGSN